MVERTYTVAQAAEVLQLHPDAVLSLIHSGDLQAANVNVRRGAMRPRWRITDADLGRFLLARKTGQVETSPRRRRAKAAKDYFGGEG